MNKDEIIEEISSKIKSIVQTQLISLSNLDLNRNTFCEIELKIRKHVQEIGRELLEQSIPLLYGDGYIGSKFKNDLNEECTCVLRENKRIFISTFGKIEFIRACYINTVEGNSFSLMDSKLDIQNKVKISPALRYFSGLLGINNPYEESSTLLEKLINIKLSSTKIDDLLQEKGAKKNIIYRNKIKDISHDSDDRIPSAKINHSETPKRVVYLQTDGCHIPTLEGWNECKTFVLFEVEKFTNSKNEEENGLINKKYYSTMNQIVGFKKQLKVAIEEYCKNDDVQIVCIGDGAAWIWKMCNELFQGKAIEILDWYHIDEKVCELSNKIFDEKEEILKEEFQFEIKGLLYKGKIKEATKILHGYYEQINKVFVQDLMGVIGYIENNKSRINYSKYKEEMNLIIGSGAIESANKYVVQRRMKLSGMRWEKTKANNIAQLRADYINGDFDKLYGIRNNFKFSSENEIIV